MSFSLIALAIRVLQVVKKDPPRTARGVNYCSLEMSGGVPGGVSLFGFWILADKTCVDRSVGIL